MVSIFTPRRRSEPLQTPYRREGWYRIENMESLAPAISEYMDTPETPGTLKPKTIEAATQQFHTLPKPFNNTSINELFKIDTGKMVFGHRQHTNHAKSAGSGPDQTSTSHPRSNALEKQHKKRSPVGKAPEARNTPPEVKAIPELGGVLTPKGNLIIEPAIEYSHSQVNRFTFRGVAILSTFLVGVLETEDADRDLISPALTLRYGITDRIELETKLPYVFRDDELTIRIPQLETGDQTGPIERNLNGRGIGDVEAALHYQINRGLDGWPFVVGNLRYKSKTGNGPFDVDRDANGIETELATGSGFQSIEPSLTVLYASDPAVFFANIAYNYALKEDVNKNIGSVRVGKFTPGNTFRLNFGMAYSINERTSFTLGFKNDFIEKSDIETNGVEQSSSTLNVGAVLLGFGFQINSRFSINLNLELGVTEDAPDTAMTLRIPYMLNLF